jgi:hypothetical protein
MRLTAFTEGDIGYTVFKALAEMMVSLGLVESYGGFQAWSGGFAEARCPTSRRPRDSVRPSGYRTSANRMASEQRISVPTSFCRCPSTPLQFRATARTNTFGKKISGRMMRYKPMQNTESVERRLKKPNAFLTASS